MYQVVDKAQSRSHDISIADFVGRLTLLEKKRTLLFVLRLHLPCLADFLLHFQLCVFSLSRPLVLTLAYVRAVFDTKKIAYNGFGRWRTRKMTALSVSALVTQPLLRKRKSGLL